MWNVLTFIALVILLVFCGGPYFVVFMEHPILFIIYVVLRAMSCGLIKEPKLGISIKAASPPLHIFMMQ